MKKTDRKNIVESIIKSEEKHKKKPERNYRRLAKNAAAVFMVIFLFGALALVDYQSRGIGGYTESGIFEFSYSGNDVKFIVMNQDLSFELPGFIKDIKDFFSELGYKIYNFINSF